MALPGQPLGTHLNCDGAETLRTGCLLNLANALVRTIVRERICAGEPGPGPIEDARAGKLVRAVWIFLGCGAESDGAVFRGICDFDRDGTSLDTRKRTRGRLERVRMHADHRFGVFLHGSLYGLCGLRNHRGCCKEQDDARGRRIKSLHVLSSLAEQTIPTNDLRFFRTDPLIVKPGIWIVQARTRDGHRIIRFPCKCGQPRSPRIDSGKRQRVAIDDGCLGVCIVHHGNRVVGPDDKSKRVVWIGTVCRVVYPTRPDTCAGRHGWWT